MLSFLLKPGSTWNPFSTQTLLGMSRVLYRNLKDFLSARESDAFLRSLRAVRPLPVLAFKMVKKVMSWCEEEPSRRRGIHTAREKKPHKKLHFIEE